MLPMNQILENIRNADVSTLLDSFATFTVRTEDFGSHLGLTMEEYMKETDVLHAIRNEILKRAGEGENH